LILLDFSSWFSRKFFPRYAKVIHIEGGRKGGGSLNFHAALVSFHVTAVTSKDTMVVLAQNS
jgi:hypothetical protein